MMETTRRDFLRDARDKALDVFLLGSVVSAGSYLYSVFSKRKKKEGRTKNHTSFNRKQNIRKTNERTVEDLVNDSVDGISQSPKSYRRFDRRNRNFLMCDDEFRDYKEVSQSEIQSLLERYGSALSKPIETIDGPLYFSKLVTELAEEYKITPLFWVARAQTESRGITKQKLTKRDLKRLLGCGLRDDGVVVGRYEGFKRQLSGSAKVLNNHFSRFSQGSQLKVNDGKQTIQPENASTYAFYKYTPWTETNKIGGSFLFIGLFEKYLKEIVSRRK